MKNVLRSLGEVGLCEGSAERGRAQEFIPSTPQWRSATKWSDPCVCNLQFTSLL